MLLHKKNCFSKVQQRAIPSVPSFYSLFLQYVHIVWYEDSATSMKIFLQLSQGRKSKVFCDMTEKHLPFAYVHTKQLFRLTPIEPSFTLKVILLLTFHFKAIDPDLFYHFFSKSNLSDGWPLFLVKGPMYIHPSQLSISCVSWKIVLPLQGLSQLPSFWNGNWLR